MGYVQDNVSKSCRCPLSQFESSTGNSGTESPCTEYPVLVNIHISMQTTFDAALADPYTQNFKDLSKSVSAWAKSNFATVLSNITGQVVDLSDIDAVVIEFRNGSIIADILLRSRKTVSVTSKDLRLKIDEMAESLPDSIEISGAPVPITVQTVPFDRCVVEGQSFCFPTATTKCVFDAQTEESSCQCLPGSSWVPGETRSCRSTSASDSDTPWELIYILSGVGGAIIVVLLGIFCFLTQRRRATATKHAQLDQDHIRTAAIELPENAYDEVGYRRFSRLRGVEQKTPFRDGPVYPVSMMTEVDDDPDYSISGHSRDGSSVIESSSGVGSFGNPYSDESLRDRFAPPPRRGYGRTVGGPSAPYYGPKLPPPDYE
ncbi:hypothetical protein BV898_16021 [Hypsibius exemplaris]|uniref:SEA domain-containing protein n=1 Tax=Hypsibius exemplaris TaxID=2072580 RepID=A0A9X6NCE8_HYPEX|nr:hypothetical protein BV898_16021 [Hypsibius exemplaris]